MCAHTLNYAFLIILENMIKRLIFSSNAVTKILSFKYEAIHIATHCKSG